MDSIQLELTMPEQPGHRLPPRIVVNADDGVITPGAHAVIECGSEIELTLEELQWLRDRGIPAAIAKLTELTAAGG